MQETGINGQRPRGNLTSIWRRFCSISATNLSLDATLNLSSDCLLQILLSFCPQFTVWLYEHICSDLIVDIQLCHQILLYSMFGNSRDNAHFDS